MHYTYAQQYQVYQFFLMTFHKETAGYYIKNSYQL